MGCFWTIVFLAGFVFVMVSFIRWFEQTAEAVDNGWWNKVMVLLMMPFAVWFYPSRVAAGRSTPVPHHEPVRGFGSLPKSPEPGPAPATLPETAPAPPPASSDQPPPGTPKEFLGLPKMTSAKPRAAPDLDKIARLKQKMREQGMLPPEE
jgi:hypothetical protein